MLRPTPCRYSSIITQNMNCISRFQSQQDHLTHFSQIPTLCILIHVHHDLFEWPNMLAMKMLGCIRYLIPVEYTADIPHPLFPQMIQYLRNGIVMKLMQDTSRIPVVIMQGRTTQHLCPIILEAFLHQCKLLEMMSVTMKTIIVHQDYNRYHHGVYTILLPLYPCQINGTACFYRYY